MALIKCKACGNEISKNAKACPKCGEVPKRTSLFTWIVTIFAVIWMIGYLGAQGGSSSSSASSSPRIANSHDFELNFLTLDKIVLRKGGFDNILFASFTIKNDGDEDVKDIEISCEDFAKSGTQVDSNKKVVYEVVKAHKTKKIHNFDLGFIHSQADTFSCRVTDFSSI